MKPAAQIVGAHGRTGEGIVRGKWLEPSGKSARDAKFDKIGNPVSTDHPNPRTRYTESTASVSTRPEATADIHEIGKDKPNLVRKPPRIACLQHICLSALKECASS